MAHGSDGFIHRLSWLTLIVAVFSAFLGWVCLDSDGVFPLVLAASFFWIGACLCLRARPGWVYPFVGALSPFAVIPMMGFFMLIGEADLAERNIIDVLEGALAETFSGVFMMLFYAPVMILFLSPIGAIIGAVAHLFMRDQRRQ